MAHKKINDIKDIEKMTKLSYRTVSKLYYEKELETIKLETFIRVCDALECTLNELIEYVPAKNS